MSDVYYRDTLKDFFNKNKEFKIAICRKTGDCFSEICSLHFQSLILAEPDISLLQSSNPD